MRSNLTQTPGSKNGLESTKMKDSISTSPQIIITLYTSKICIISFITNEFHNCMIFLFWQKGENLFKYIVQIHQVWICDTSSLSSFRNQSQGTPLGMPVYKRSYVYLHRTKDGQQEYISIPQSICNYISFTVNLMQTDHPFGPSIPLAEKHLAIIN